MAKKGWWAKELPQVLWSYHTTPHSTTNETLFRLTIGTEVVIPVEVREPSPRTALFEPSGNEEELRTNLDMLQEIREKTRVIPIFEELRANLDIILEEAGRGAYRLESLDGRRVLQTWNAANLRISKSDYNQLRTDYKARKTDGRKDRSRVLLQPTMNGLQGPKMDDRIDRSKVLLQSTTNELQGPKNGQSKRRSKVLLQSTTNKLQGPKNGRSKRPIQGLTTIDYKRTTRPKNRLSNRLIRI
ncbi:hypothetical protein CR513_58761, partial [Mucuna pruriens]